LSEPDDITTIAAELEARLNTEWDRMGEPHHQADDVDWEFFAPPWTEGRSLRWTDDEVRKFAEGVAWRREWIAERAPDPMARLVPDWESVRHMIEKESA
jgi:hypothetical protein